ncbi:MAG TPA: hypothetical protein VGF48_05075 [Thermoanaerobaculia bacterium]
MSDRFAIAAREELWVGGRLVESRLMHGIADRDRDVIEASDAPDEELLARLDTIWTAVATPPLSPLRKLRIVGRATTDETSLALIVTHNGISVVTTPGHFAHDLSLIPERRGTREAPWRELPLVWRNGSAAVLLHEAVGHPLERDLPPLDLPEWLTVDVPLAWRRESFRDVPLRRMTTLTVTQHDAPFALPAQFIEVELLDGGYYEVLDDTITLSVAAASLDGEALAPFTISVKRSDIVFHGADGEPLRYPGVVCSSEGQELIVGSYAPVMTTSFR